MRSAVFLWRRLDSPGHDACRLEKLETGYQLAGMAAFLESDRICQLKYRVVADHSFQTKSALIEGVVGSREISVSIRAGGARRWRVNGAEQPQLLGCIDLDLGFTPATNLLPVRRLGLRVGQEAEAPAVYLDIPAIKVLVLPQRYKRISRNEYAYESPAHGYRATLQVSRLGAIELYPGVFELERSK